MERVNNRSEQIERKKPLQSTVEVVVGEKGVASNVFIVEGEKKFDLYEYLPKGAKFVADDFFGHKFFPGDFENDKGLPPRVTFPREGINSVSGKLGILHEMGHAIMAHERGQSRSPHFMDVIHTIDLVMRAIKKSDVYEQLKTQQERDEYLLQEFEKARKSGWPPELQSDEKMAESIQALAQEERSAWAGALQLSRKIKTEKNIDMFDEATFNDIRKLIDSDLKDYQDAYGKLVPEQRAKLFLVNKLGAQDASSV